MSKLMNKFESLQAEMAAVRAKFQVEAQELFKEVTKEFFDKNPKITAIIWTQYTPYFNDGDTCVFSVGDAYFTNANEEQMEDFTSYGEYEGDEETVFSMNDYELTGDSEWSVNERAKYDMTGLDKKSIKAFSKVLQSNEMEDVMLEMFGDHVRVVTTRDGFDVNDYDHD